MQELVFIVLVYMTPMTAAPYELGIDTTTYGTLEDCLAALPESVIAEMGERFFADSVTGVACVTPATADAVMAANDRIRELNARGD